MQPITIGSLRIDGSKPLLVAGPCVIESEDETIAIARTIASLPVVGECYFVFKASYTKDNRTAADSFRGVGIEEGLRILSRVRETVGCPVLSDVHSVAEVQEAAEALDVLQVPAFLSRQTSLLEAVASAQRAVNVKKGQFLSPDGAVLAVDKVRRAGGRNVFLTERGTTFGYSDLVVDFRSFERMRAADCPIVFDVTHSLQRPGGLGDRSGGEPGLAAMMARAAAAVPVDGFFIETHPEPDRAGSDAASMLPLERLEPLLKQALDVFQLARRLTGAQHSTNDPAQG